MQQNYIIIVIKVRQPTFVEPSLISSCLQPLSKRHIRFTVKAQYFCYFDIVCHLLRQLIHYLLVIRHSLFKLAIGGMLFPLGLSDPFREDTLGLLKQ